MIKYQNFDLEAADYRQTTTAHKFNVRVLDSPVGQQNREEAAQVELPLEARKLVGRLQNRKQNQKDMIDLGLLLGKALFPPSVLNLLNASLLRLRGDDEALRIRLKLGKEALAELPWEYVYLPASETPAASRGSEGFLVLNRRVSLVRYEAQVGQLVPVAPGVKTLRMIALLASPESPEYPRLDLARERQWIEKALQGVSNIRADFYPNAGIDTLGDALVNPAHIFHFSGHGDFDAQMSASYGSQTGSGVIVLEGEDHCAVRFEAVKLAKNLTGKGVRLAVLTACEVGQRDAANPWAGVVPALSRAGIPAVIGMQFSILDTSAADFSRAFYRTLAAHQPIDAAVFDGRLAIYNKASEDERDWGVPVLYLRADHADDGVLFPNGGEREPEGRRDDRQGTSQPTQPRNGSPVDKRVLRDAMIKSFSSAELEILCADVEAELASRGNDLQYNLDVVGGGSKPMQILNMIEFLDRRGLLQTLVEVVRQHRPGVL